ncbi:MAG: hypothetical protein IIB39_02385 [Candidatus Marinimicrobia bacterium]|nr:hypothetical protein [Candidatus Neomarinimicrobiota bacterium]
MSEINSFLKQNFPPPGGFERFSPHEMHGLIYTPFDEAQSPQRLNKDLNASQLDQIKIFSDIMMFTRMLEERQPLKLTQKGNLPKKFCVDLYDSGIKDEDLIALKGHPINREADSPYIFIIKLLTRNLGLTKKRYSRLSLTQKGEKTLTDPISVSLFCDLFVLYTQKYNWAYQDGYPESWIIQAGFGFSIFLVQMYGSKSRSTDFYSDKFLNAFPKALNDFKETEYQTGKRAYQNAYSLRTFSRFLKRFNLIKMSDKQTIRKRPLIDQLVGWKN